MTEMQIGACAKKHVPCNCFDHGHIGRLHCARCGHGLGYAAARFCRHGVSLGRYCQSCGGDIAGGDDPASVTAVGGGCGCTIHDDRGTPCPNQARICLPCDRECWGEDAELRMGIEDILRNGSTYHDVGTITSRLRRLLDYEDAEPLVGNDFIRVNTIYATHRAKDTLDEHTTCVLDGQAWPCDTRVVLDRLGDAEAEGKVWRTTAVERTRELHAEIKRRDTARATTPVSDDTEGAG